MITCGRALEAWEPLLLPGFLQLAQNECSCLRVATQSLKASLGEHGPEFVLTMRPADQPGRCKARYRGLHFKLPCPIGQ